VGQSLRNLGIQMKVELTAKEIADLAEFAGFTINRQDVAEDELETPYTVADCPASGVKDEADGVPRHYAHIAYLSEYQEEGVHPLGDELITPPAKIEMGHKIVLGSTVKWKSQAAGSWKIKGGMVVQVVQRKKFPTAKYKIGTSALPRDYESYVVQVGNKFYWPRVSALELVWGTEAAAILQGIKGKETGVKR
jgi:hypothetical protein